MAGDTTHADSLVQDLNERRFARCACASEFN